MPVLSATSRKKYNTSFDGCSIKSDKIAEVDAAVAKILAHRTEYEAIAKAVNTPWYLIAALHYREASLNFKCHLHNGDPLTARTVHVPKGRPATGEAPFSFVVSAIDALTLDGLTNFADLTVANLLWRMERFNGTGYQARGMNSPYVWSFTNQYEKGKYVGDGVFDADFVDGQSGTAAILLRLYEKGAISLLGESISVTVAGKSTTIPAYIVRGNSWVGARALVDATGVAIASVEDSPRTITLSKGGQTNGKAKAIAAQVIGGVGYVDASDAAAFLGRSISYNAATRALAIS